MIIKRDCHDVRISLDENAVNYAGLRTEATIGVLAMAKPKRCVHCGEESTKTTMDHVFPASWYPSTTPPNLQRWTVPSCATCNGTLGTMEKELFIRLAMCVDPRKAEAAGLSAKAVRSIGIGAEGLSVKERTYREALKQKVLASAQRYQPGTETFPGLGPHGDFPVGEQWIVTFPADILAAVAKKIVRGSEYVLAKRIVEQPYDMRVYFAHDQDVPEPLGRAFQCSAAQTAHLGPGFRLFRIVPHDEPNTAIYKIVVWGTVVIYGAIIPNDPPVIESERIKQDAPLSRERERPTSGKIGFSAVRLVLGAFCVWALFIGLARLRNRK